MKFLEPIFVVFVLIGAACHPLMSKEANVSLEELNALLLENTGKLREAFETKDGASEERLYRERHNILLARRNLRPKSTQRPLVHLGNVESISKSEIHLRTRPGRGVSIGVGPIHIPEVHAAFRAIKVGDEVELTFTHEASLYDDSQYAHELTRVRQLGESDALTLLLAQEKGLNAEVTLSQVLGKQTDGSIVLIATVRNTGSEPMPFDDGKGVRVLVSGASGLQPLRHSAATTRTAIRSGAVGVIQIEIPSFPEDQIAASVQIQAPDNSFLFSEVVPIRSTR